MQYFTMHFAICQEFSYYIMKTKYEEKKNAYETAILNEKLAKEAIDITLPSKKVKRGSKHPMTRITEEFEDLFVSMGYTVYEGPEIESDENCFQKLNLPKGHPARDAQDTYYLKDEEIHPETIRYIMGLGLEFKECSKEERFYRAIPESVDAYKLVGRLAY